MQLVALAECYGVGKVIMEVAAHLLHIGVTQGMPLDTAAAVFEVPEACLSVSPFQLVGQYAANKLQQELGDLEVAWRKQSKREALLALPFGALLQLLGDWRTRVASEDTVVMTIASWPTEHGDPRCRRPLLMEAMRLQYCSAPYFSYSNSVLQLRDWGFTEAELDGLRAMCGLSSDQQRQEMARGSFPHRAAWQLPRRPASCLTQLRMEFKVPLAVVAEAAVQAQTSGQGMAVRLEHWWHGRKWTFGLYATPEGRYNMFLQCRTPVTRCTLSLLLCTTSRQVYGPINKQCEMGRKGYEELAPGLLGLGGSWAEVRRWLAEKDLIHPGDMLHLTCTVSAVT
jgi:hypothetical protein